MRQSETAAGSAATDLVTLGETMVLFQTLQEGPIQYAPLFTRSIAGAESNVAIAMRRLGRSARWISRLGNDPFGDLIASTLAGEGIDVSRVLRDVQAPTALFFREFRGFGEPSAYYYRSRSAASRLAAEDVSPLWFQNARLFHVTGITPALSESAREALFAAMRLARDMGLIVSFDPNLRRKLWPEEEARRVLLDMLPLCDLFLPGREEAEFLAGERNAEEYGGIFMDLGPRVIALKRGADGSLGFTKDLRMERPAYPLPSIVDPIGAGDAFAAGFLSALLEDADLDPARLDAETFHRALERANLMGALATQFKGDWEGLPALQDLDLIQSGLRKITR
jgi:2-dehydro-3-deoxygluconokinase